MARRWVLCGLAAVLGFGFVTANANAGLVDATTSFSAATPWDGFGEDFSPEWQGKTTVVTDWVWTTSTGSVGWTSSSATMMSLNWGGNNTYTVLVPGHWETHPTVRKISSSSDTAALSSAWLRVGGSEYTATKNDYDGSQMARYASLVSPGDTLLANGSAIAYQNTSFGDDEFSADGRVSAMSILTNAAEEASASATGRSWLDATYELTQETAFSLNLDIARLGEVEISFTATDTATGKVAFSFATMDTGTQQEISMTGILDAGEYKFALNCLTDTSVDSFGGLNFGGQAMFDLSLDLEEEYVQVWVPDYYESFSGFRAVPAAVYDPADFGSGGEITIGSVMTFGSFSAVPEPSMLALLALSGTACLLSGWRRRKSG